MTEDSKGLKVGNTSKVSHVSRKPLQRIHVTYTTPYAGYVAEVVFRNHCIIYHLFPDTKWLSCSHSVVEKINNVIFLYYYALILDKFQNVAVGQPTTQSSTPSSYFGNSAHAVDGNWNTDYYSRSCTRTNEETNPWWRVDLGKEKEVFEVKVANRQDYGHRLNGFEIRVGKYTGLYLFEIYLHSVRMIGY